jgi:hypothetical protein
MAASLPVVISSDQSAVATTPDVSRAAGASDATTTRVVIATNQTTIPVLTNNSLVKVAYDALVPTFNATSDVWVYKTGGILGTTVATVTINYVDATKAVILNVAVV